MSNNVFEKIKDGIKYPFEMYEPKEIVVGTAIALAVTAGVAVGSVALVKEIKRSDTQVTYNGQEYDLGSLYLLSDGQDEILCYKEELSNKTITNFNTGIALGDHLMVSQNGIGIGYRISGNSSMATNYGVNSVRNDSVYGYVSADTNQIMCLEGGEKKFGYKAKSVKKYVSYEEAKENEFKFSFDEITAKIEMQEENAKSK